MSQLRKFVDVAFNSPDEPFQLREYFVYVR